VESTGFIDLHSHWVAAIDDGARSTVESAELLRGLKSIGFDRVIATPHMRPGMFDNTKADLERAYEATVSALSGQPGLPEVGLSSEHWFDDLVFGRLLSGDALPYPGGHGALVEFPPASFPAKVTHRFFDLRARRLRPVLAHPERYEPVWRDREVLDPILDGGTVLLLDLCSLVGKYGRAPRRAAEELLEEGYYYAACSDAHAPRDVADVEKGIRALVSLAGDEEAAFLLRQGPKDILEGTVDA
jgi:protein-tyrosine phosphatase